VFLNFISPFASEETEDDTIKCRKILSICNGHQQDGREEKEPTHLRAANASLGSFFPSFPLGFSSLADSLIAADNLQATYGWIYSRNQAETPTSHHPLPISHIPHHIPDSRLQHMCVPYYISARVPTPRALRIAAYRLWHGFWATYLAVECKSYASVFACTHECVWGSV